MSEFLEVVSPSALKQLQEVNAELLKTIASVKDVNSNMIGIKTPSGSDSAIKKLTADYDAQSKSIQNLQNQLTKLSEKQNNNNNTTNKNVQAILNQSKSYQDLAKQKEKALALASKEEAILARANNLYNKTEAKVKELSQTYNNLAIKKELGNKLTAREEAQLSKLVTELNIYQSALKKVDVDIQKHTRSVGNYASGWNGLGNSINQLTREAPAFAVSLNTGFLALSNNLPILFDEISKVKSANKDLIAQGQPVKSTFMQLAGAVLSWQTALSVGVLLLTLYGGKIIDSINGSERKKKALEAEKKAIEDKVQAEKEQNDAIGQSIASEQNRARILFEIAKNEEVSSKKRNEALKELRSRYTSYLKDLTDEEILAGKTADAEERLNKALVGRGYALATQNLLEKNATDQMALQVEYQKVTAKGFEKINTLRNSDGSIKNIKEYNNELAKQARINGVALNVLNNKLAPLKEEEQVLLSLFRGNAQYLDAVNETNNADKNSLKVKEDKNKIDLDSIKALENTINALKTLRSETSLISTNYNLLGVQIELLETIHAGLVNEMTKGQEEIREGIALTDEEVYADIFAWYKLRDATNEYIRTLSSGYIEKSLDSIGLSSLKMFTDFDIHGQSTFDKLLEGADTLKEKFAVTFQAIGDVAQNVFNAIANSQQQNFDAQYYRLEQERDVAILFAGESVSARKEIEEQYEQRRKVIARREAKAKQQQAIFNIAIDTGQAIVAQLAATPLPFGSGFVALIAAIGAAQIAMVSSQKIPQYYKGTDNAQGGFAWTQEKGAEIITDKSGNIKSMGSNKGAQLTMLAKGDKVFTAEKSALMFDEGLNSILANNGISMPKIEINTDTKILADKLDNLTSTIANKESFKAVKDVRGYRVYQRKQAEEKQLLNNVLTYKGIDV